MFFLASHSYRCVAHDRRGHGRSSQPWQGNDMDTSGQLSTSQIVNLTILTSHLTTEDWTNIL